MLRRPTPRNDDFIMEKNIFARFATGELRPDTVRYEDDQMLAFDDIHPKAPVHVLIIPKKEIVSIAEMSEADAHLIASLI